MSSDAVGPSLPAHVQKKSKRKRDDGVELKSSSGVDYSVVHTAPLVDARFERQMKARQAGKEVKSVERYFPYIVYERSCMRLFSKGISQHNHHYLAPLEHPPRLWMR